MTSGGNNFNDFPENQLCKPTWWNATVLLFPLVLISSGGTASSPQKNIWGNSVPCVHPHIHYYSHQFVIFIVITTISLHITPSLSLSRLKTYLFHKSFLP